VKIKMDKYVQDILSDLPEYFDGEAVTPAASDLFTIDVKSVVLDNADHNFYHTYTAKLLFLCKRARPDTQTAVAFLCTRVQSSTRQDLDKLQRCLQYLRHTKQLYLTIEAHNLNIIKWWVDASFAVHHDMRSHTGGTLSLGRGAIYSTSRRQRINTRSSTEAELVGVDDVVPQIMWTNYFLQHQGYGSTDTIVYQDNKSTILLASNGRASSSKRTRHMNIRYYFIADRVKAKELRIEYCPTKEMMADFHTKPLQGALFYKLRAEVLNLPDSSHNQSSTLDDDVATADDTSPVAQECVGG
jgi:hypothetical protein